MRPNTFGAPLGRWALLLACVLGVVGAACRTTPPETDSRPTADASAAPATPPVTPPPAETVVAAAVKEARAGGKAVLIEFGASWCTWCRNFEAFVKAPETAPVISKHFVVLNLIVRERDDKTPLEHPGGNELMNQWGGAKSGLPFYVFLDGAGQKVADSNAMPDGSNIGFPAVRAEISAFMALMRKAAPSMTPAEREALDAYLVRMMSASAD